MRTDEHRASFYKYYETGKMTKAQIIDEDRRAQQSIEDAENLIKWLKAHRVELAERYRELEAMESHIRVTLKRQKNWTNNKIFYFLMNDKVFDDGTVEFISSKKFAGTERNKAIKEFNNIKKRLPKQEYILDIEKGPWE